MESNVVTHNFCVFAQVSAFVAYFPLLLKPMLCHSHQGDAIPSLGSLTLNEFIFSNATGYISKTS